VRVALVHDWLIHMRGGEKVLDALAEMYPEAEIYTLFYNRKRLSQNLQKKKITASWLQWVPGIRLFYRWFLPVLPFVVRSLKLKAADLVLSSSHCVAKGVRLPGGARHICYCHAPMRYAWGFENEYFSSFLPPFRGLIRYILKRLRRWDTDVNASVHKFVSNSENIRKKIEKCYGRTATVVYPPLDYQYFQNPAAGHRDYYLVVSAFVPYKRIDIVIDAFNRLDRKLMIIGSGPLASRYEQMRKSSNISFVGNVSGEQLKALYAGAKALIFPTDEDFGIVPLEAQACGTPVIALGRGGALESVKTGLFFMTQKEDAVRKAVLEFEAQKWDYQTISMKVEMFSKIHFQESMRLVIDAEMSAGHETYVAS